MASVRTFSEVLDSMAVATWRHMKKTVVDQIFDEIVFYNYLRSKGKIQSYQGGKYIETPLSNAEQCRLRLDHRRRKTEDGRRKTLTRGIRSCD